MNQRAAKGALIYSPQDKDGAIHRAATAFSAIAIAMGIVLIIGANAHSLGGIARAAVGIALCTGPVIGMRVYWTRL
jgi:hypothetical protein